MTTRSCDIRVRKMDFGKYKRLIFRIIMKIWSEPWSISVWGTHLTIPRAWWSVNNIFTSTFCPVVIVTAFLDNKIRLADDKIVYLYKTKNKSWKLYIRSSNRHKLESNRRWFILSGIQSCTICFDVTHCNVRVTEENRKKSKKRKRGKSMENKCYYAPQVVHWQMRKV